MCSDTNYIIRLDAAIFFREYLQEHASALIGTARLEEYFLPEIYELLNDEESYVRIEAIEAVLEVLEKLELQMIEDEFIPNLIKTLSLEKNHDEIIVRMSKNIGKIVYKLSAFDLHVKYKEELLTFFKAMVNYKDEECVIYGIYNLPCFHALYRDKVKAPPGTAATQSTQVTETPNGEEVKFEEEFGSAEEIDFQDLYYQYANKQNIRMREITASCVHEAFKLVNDTEDIRKLQMTVLELLSEDNKTVI